MPVLQLDDQQFPLMTGATRIGFGADADVALPAGGEEGVHAVVATDLGAGFAISRATANAVVRVNGVSLGAEPVPLMHGDRIELAGHELRFADDTKGGATQYVYASEIAEMVGLTRGVATRLTTASGGRLVSLVDGKEYTIPSMGVVFGRDAGADVVVGQDEVSRRHAEIAPDERGYILRDTSANGVFVNGARVQGSHRLARSDVIRIGSEEFRFYADVAPVTRPVRPEVAISEPVPAAPEPGAILATLVPRGRNASTEGSHELRTLPAHVGRGAHNAVRLTDSSVSESHATLQQRDDAWYVVDMESTNGTFVGDARVLGERRLDGASELRFGEVTMRFEPATGAAALGRTSQGIQPTGAVVRPNLESEQDERAPSAQRDGVRGWVWAALAAAVGAAYYAFKGRA